MTIIHVRLCPGWVRGGGPKIPAASPIGIEGTLGRVLPLLLESCRAVDALEIAVCETNRVEEIAQFHLAMSFLANIGAIECVLRRHDEEVAILRGCWPGYINVFEDEYQLSRFAVIHFDGGGLCIETPFSTGSLTVFTKRAVSLLWNLATPSSLSNLVDGCDNLGEQLIGAILGTLQAIGAIRKVKNEEPEPLLQWEWHDAIFHARSRKGRTIKPVGGTYRFLGKHSPEGALPKRSWSEKIKLPEGTLPENVVELNNLLLSRKSIRSSRVPINVAQLGIFLHMVGRNLNIVPANTEPGQHYDTVRRTYPGGGACHELELYVLVNRCVGLERGVYWYNGDKDALFVVAKPTPHSERLISSAALSMGSEQLPDILICISARFGRVNWKYEGLAYATILKNVGVLFQTMYLVATALELAPCAIGSGNTLDFLSVTKGEPFIEESVGEFALSG